MRGFVVAALIVASAPAFAQDNAFAKLDASSALELRRLVDSATQRGLPSDAVIGQARHGALFGVPGAKIVAAARTLTAQLAAARQALSPPEPSPQEIRSGAEALLQGATPDALVAVRRASGTKPVAVPLGLLTQLLASKVSLPRATEIVVDLVRRGAEPRQLADLGNNLSLDVARGEAPERSLAVHLQALTAVLPAAPGTSVTVPSAATPVPKKP